MRRDGLTPFPSNSNRRYNIEMNTSHLQHALMDALANAKDEIFLTEQDYRSLIAQSSATDIQETSKENRTFSDPPDVVAQRE